MMRHIAFVVAMFYVAFAIGQENETNAALKENTQRIVQGNNAFATELYAQVKNSKGNLAYSPYGIESALSIPFLGSQDITQFQMEKVLHLQISSGTVDQSFAELNRQLASRPSDVSDDYRLLLATSLWLQNGLIVTDKFLDTVKRSYKSGFYRADFMQQPESSRFEINHWVKEHTLGKIADLLGPGDIKSATRMVVVSCIYLKAKWAQIFNSHNTSPQPFFADSDTTLSVPTMYSTATYPFYHTDRFSMLQLDYVPATNGNTRLAMLILLPNQRDGLPELESIFTSENLRKWIDSLKKERINVFLPKFKITKSLNLTDTLQHMGMFNPFSDEADFSGISGAKNLKISDVLHKAIIDVDEAGTEAVAATAVTINMTAIGGESPVEFRADHPFIYVIYDKTTGVILFAGRLTNPTT